MWCMYLRTCQLGELQLGINPTGVLQGAVTCPCIGGQGLKAGLLSCQLALGRVDSGGCSAS
jgi:hypothetical protein